MNKVEDIVAAIKEAKTAIVVAHVNPDGDTLGSMLAIAKVLEQAGVERVDRVMHDKVPETYSFFPDQEKVLCSQNEADTAKLLEEYDLSFSCDCGSVERLGTAGAFWAKAKKTGNVDHHKSNTLFADLNYVEAEATSTGQVVHHIASKLGSKIDNDLASLMYITLLTDTGGFMHSNTNENAFSWASELVAHGANPNKLYHQLFNCMPYKTIRVIGDALNKIEIHELSLNNGKEKINFAYTWTSRDFLDSLDADDEDTDEIVDHIMRIKNLEFSIYLREGRKPGMMKGSLRSSTEKIDCSKLATQINGGGHARAAGFNIEGDFDSVKKNVLELLKAS